MLKNTWTRELVDDACVKLVTIYHHCTSLGLEVGETALEGYLEKEATVVEAMLWPILSGAFVSLSKEKTISIKGIEKGITDAVTKHLDDILFALTCYEVLGVDCNAKGGFTKYLGNTTLTEDGQEVFDLIKTTKKVMVDARNKIINATTESN